MTDGPISSAPARAVELPERYVDRGLFARGGWGEVRRVHDRAMDRVVLAKILAWEHLESPRERARFLNEARVTASLDHPGIVPVLDGGTLPDGRPWFAMKEIAGKTLLEILSAPSKLEPATQTRRHVETLLRVAEIVGYAHERGVVHRDLKPGNIMVGRFGEVLVLDWGIARVGTQKRSRRRPPPPASGESAMTSVGDVLGTIAYMAPEQARGDADVGPHADVYALGLILFEILHGRRARDGAAVAMWGAAAQGLVPPIETGPDDLRALCASTLSASPKDRPKNGALVAQALRAWLDGELNVQRAQDAVRSAEVFASEVDALQVRRQVLRAELSSAAAQLEDHATAERKYRLWDLEDAIAELDLQIELGRTRQIESLRQSLEHLPEHAPAHAALASIHRTRLIAAEERGDRVAAAHDELLLRQHDRGEHVELLRGTEKFRLDSDPSGAEISLYRYQLVHRRLVLEPAGPLGRTPKSVTLPVGSYLLVLEHGGMRARYPVVIRRGEPWQMRRPGSDQPTPVLLLQTTSEDEIYVPGGFTWVGYDERAAEPVPSRSLWVDGFVMQRDPVTCRDYLAFLDDLGERGREADAWRFAPETARATNVAAGPAVAREAGRFRLLPDEHGRIPSLDCPIASVDWHAARAYAAWWSHVTGHAWRLPNELEWEKAARGVDRRIFPWGAQAEATWANILGSTADAPQRRPVDAHPIDESPYGVRGMAGNVRDWCANEWTIDGPRVTDDVLVIEAPPEDDSLKAIRGGAWTSAIAFARCAGRFAAKPDERFSVVGLRLVRSVPESRTQ